MYRIISDEKKIDISPEMLGREAFDLVKINENTFHLIENEQSYLLELIAFHQESKEVSLRINGKVCRLKVKDKFDLLLEKMGFGNAAAAKVSEVKAPMPGLVHQIVVEEGQNVKKGEPLLILEAMKMENVIKSPADGVVSKVRVKKGQNVEKNQVLIQFV